MRNDTKRKFGTMFFVALFVFFGHWWDFFYMIKPGARIAAFEAKEMAEGKKPGAEVAPLSEAAPATEHHTEAAPAEATEAHAAEGHATGETVHVEAAAHGEKHGEHAEAKEHGPDKSFKLGFTLPGLEELGIFIGFLSLFLFFFFGQLQRASLVPMKDPYLEESLHHDTGALIEGEDDGHDSAHH
jgi:hypothetical protein